LLEGLEAVELKLSDIKNDNVNFRFDNEYFLTRYIKLDRSIKNFGFSKLKDLSEKITDFGAYSQMNIVEFVQNGILFLRNQDVKANQISIQSNVYIEDKVYEKLTLKLEENDVLIPRVGTLGNAGVIEKKHLPCSANQKFSYSSFKKGYFTLLYFNSINIENWKRSNKQMFDRKCSTMVEFRGNK